MRILGFVLYPGVPNTTAFSKETDQNYGLFKSVFIENLEQLTHFCNETNNPVSLQPWIVGLVVFGGYEEVSGRTVSKNAF